MSRTALFVLVSVGVLVAALVLNLDARRRAHQRFPDPSVKTWVEITTGAVLFGAVSTALGLWSAFVR
ncbi:MAG TPA: hypothetical protein VI341_12015 [Actinomycetota bacterium]